jgi:hypothetical protein
MKIKFVLIGFAVITAVGLLSGCAMAPLKGGHVSTSGVALMVLPSLIVGSELLILCGMGAAVVVWFLAHRHGQLRGLVDSVKADSENLLTPADTKTSQPPS